MPERWVMNASPFAKPAIEHIVRAGLYVQPALIHQVLKSIGETSSS